MKIKIKTEIGGWPGQLDREYSRDADITLVVEKLIREGTLPKNDANEKDEQEAEQLPKEQRVFVVRDASTDREIASYHPLMKKIICMTDEPKLRDIFGNAVAGELRITAVTMTQRRDEIADKVTGEPKQEALLSGGKKEKWWKMPDPVRMDIEESTNAPEGTPYDKEAMLLDLALSITGEEDKLPGGPTATLWLYLLGFILVCAFMVKTLISMMHYDPVTTSFPIYTPIIVNALYMLLPAALCFAAGKVVDVMLAKRKNKKK